MNKEKITVIVCGSKHGDVTTQTVENHLYSFQELVEGYIETWYNPQLDEKGICVLVNENGIHEGLPVNQNTYPFFLVGNAVFLGYAPYEEREDFQSLTDEQILFIIGWLNFTN